MTSKSIEGQINQIDKKIIKFCNKTKGMKAKRIIVLSIFLCLISSGACKQKLPTSPTNPDQSLIQKLNVGDQANNFTAKDGFVA